MRVPAELGQLTTSEKERLLIELVNAQSHFPGLTEHEFAERFLACWAVMFKKFLEKK